MTIRERLERIMVAISFAEAGELDVARTILAEEKRLRKSKRPRARPRPGHKLRAPSLD
jgi:hypothetical protein